MRGAETRPDPRHVIRTYSLSLLLRRVMFAAQSAARTEANSIVGINPPISNNVGCQHFSSVDSVGRERILSIDLGHAQSHRTSWSIVGNYAKH